MAHNIRRESQQALKPSIISRIFLFHPYFSHFFFLFLSLFFLGGGVGGFCLNPQNHSRRKQSTNTKGYIKSTTRKDQKPESTTQITNKKNAEGYLKHKN